MSVDTFSIEKEFLRALLDDVAEGSAQLPDFQRGWVWPERNIASLLASISQGYPVGTVMMLRTGGPVRFKQRPVEGAEPAPGVQPERLILDGQQRLTSLFQALRFNAPVNTQDSRRREVSGWFYIDMRAALDPHADREEAIHFASSRLHTLRTRGSAAYKGIYALLLKEGALDWRIGAPSTVDTYFDEAVDIHHIFPKHWCDQEGIDPKTYNSIVNKTPLSARTNRIIGSKGPSEYLPGLARSAKIDASTLDKYVSTHLCDPDLMRADDFQRFHAAREDALLSRISTAMGKAITETAVDYGDTLESDDDTDDL